MSLPTPPRKAFDWNLAKTRLAMASAALANVDQLSPEQAKKIMDERALKLAITPPMSPDASELLELVTFQLGGDRFGIEARFVFEMLKLKHITPVPDAPDFFVGATNLRGAVLAVLDVRGFFGAARTTAGVGSQALVMGASRTEFALLVDQVEEVATFRTTEFFDSTGTTSSLGREWVRGISASALVLLDAGTMLKDPRLFVDEDCTLIPLPER